MVITGNLMEITIRGNPMEIRGHPMVVRGDPMAIRWPSGHPMKIRSHPGKSEAIHWPSVGHQMVIRWSSDGRHRIQMHLPIRKSIPNSSAIERAFTYSRHAPFLHSPSCNNV